MSIKTLLAATAVALTATGASANAFGLGETLSDSTIVELDLVVADAAGTVELYDLSRGQQGEFLGSADVFAGANSDLRIDVGSAYKNDVLAVLKIDGQIVATHDYDVAR